MCPTYWEHFSIRTRERDLSPPRMASHTARGRSGSTNGCSVEPTAALMPLLQCRESWPPSWWRGISSNANSLFRAFDALGISSRTEGTPMVLLEAMNAGVPVVTTAVGGVPDVLTPLEALLVPAEDPRKIATALRAIHAEPRA